MVLLSVSTNARSVFVWLLSLFMGDGNTLSDVLFKLGSAVGGPVGLTRLGSGVAVAAGELESSSLLFLFGVSISIISTSWGSSAMTMVLGLTCSLGNSFLCLGFRSALGLIGVDVLVWNLKGCLGVEGAVAVVPNGSVGFWRT